MIEMHLGGLGFDPKNMSPIVLLRDKEELNFLPIWIGMFEAASIAMEIQGFKPPRPMTHDLMTRLISQFGGRVRRIVINEIRDSTFYAVIEIDMGKSESEKTVSEVVSFKVDARPSDAIAIAVRSQCGIFVSESVMVKAKMVNTEKDEKEARDFKDFVEGIQPEDFQKYFDER